MVWSEILWSVSSRVFLKSQYPPQQPSQEQVLGRPLGHVAPLPLARGGGLGLDALLGSGGRSDPYISRPTSRLVSDLSGSRT